MSGSTKNATKAQRRRERAAALRAAQQRRRRRNRVRVTVAAVVAGVLVVIGGLYGIYRASNDTDADAGSRSAKVSYEVGEPGPGERAPGFTLAASTGKRVSLADFRGKTVLLYFQEGLTCQPCWDQITDLEKRAKDVRAAGVDAVVSITTDPVDLITRKVTDMGLATPVLSDPDLAVSKAYSANEYGMMGTSRDGHSFVLVDPDGTIQWRADYGGAPKYTMYVKVNTLLADLRAGRRQP
ncbi:MAG: redoxin domain-containing protein [Streptosporangiales bacterium]|nr:redoxin domain-containing protein [Streptosporangiales bacterium]